MKRFFLMILSFAVMNATASDYDSREGGGRNKLPSDVTHSGYGSSAEMVPDYMICSVDDLSGEKTAMLKVDRGTSVETVLSDNIRLGIVYDKRMLSISTIPADDGIVPKTVEEDGVNKGTQLTLLMPDYTVYCSYIDIESR